MRCTELSASQCPAIRSPSGIASRCVVASTLLTGLISASLLPAGLARATPEEASPDAVVEPFALEEKPRWEVGVGGGYLDGFDYPASKDPNRRGIALPYFIYRSPVLRVGDGGVGAVAIERPRVRLDLSLGGSLSASSESNRARESMPDLDYLFEIGPKLDVQLLDHRFDTLGRTVLGWSAKVRAVLATDFGGVDSAGFVFATGFKAAQRDVFGWPVDVLASLESTIATEKLHDYFYEVKPRFETADRPAFDASSGYLGTRLFLALAYKPTRDLRLFAGAAIGQYSNAANEDSQLFETTSSTGLAVGFAWRLFESRERVRVLDTD